MQRICGSPDLYPPDKRPNATVNFITCHDGFTLYDLYAYNVKHNEANGWNNTDGFDDNNSWNCGEEGFSRNPEVNALRDRLRMKAMTVLLCSRGAAMFLAGDEFGNSQSGNNNAYCQDNEISWLNWEQLEQNRPFFDFVRQLIALRKAHPALRAATAPSRCGWKDLSLHNNGKAWNSEFLPETRQIGVMFVGRDAADENDDILLLALNMHWEPHSQQLPAPPQGFSWVLVLHTGAADPFAAGPLNGLSLQMGPRSAAVFRLVPTGGGI